MCSTGGDDGDILLEPKPNLPECGSTCRKCKVEKAQVVLQINDAYCKSCFLSFCSHKFRAILGKSRVFGNEARTVVIAYSGSSPSLAVVKLLSDAISAGHKRIQAHPNIVYIDEGALLEVSLETRWLQRQQIVQATENFGFPIYSVPLNVNQIAPKLVTEADIDTSDDIRIAEMFKSLPDTTSKLDLLTRLRYDVLAASARHLGASLVMLADTATSVAVKILSGIALGRGASISLETGFSDNRHPDVTFLRPLRDFTSKEATMFSIFSEINNPVFIPSFLTMSDSDGSIQRLTEDFIVTLQSEFPSTVSAIYRTGEKFCVPDCKRVCSLCMGPLDTSAKSCSALQATQYSREISTGTSTKSGGCSSCSCGKSDSSKFLEALCYSCRILAQNMEKPQLLPGYVLEKAQESQALSEMRSQIQEFLIEDDE